MVELVDLFYIVFTEVVSLPKPPAWIPFRLNCVLVVFRKCVIVVVKTGLQEKSVAS